jgi:hypothetical protein
MQPVYLTNLTRSPAACTKTLCSDFTHCPSRLAKKQALETEGKNKTRFWQKQQQNCKYSANEASTLTRFSWQMHSLLLMQLFHNAVSTEVTQGSTRVRQLHVIRLAQSL